MSPAPELSIVVAAPRSAAAARDCLRAFRSQGSAETLEVLHVGPEEAAVDGVRSLPGEAGWLVPRLWGRGIEAARAPLVALTIADCVPASDWLDTALAGAARNPGAAGFGGPILPPVGGSGKDWAAYLVRYSAYLGTPAGDAAEIPGDNAVYRRADLEAYWGERARGFWEVLFHRRLRAAGRRLVFVPELGVRLAAGPGAPAFAALRFRHGRHFGLTRELPSALYRIPAALAAPALAPVLLARVRRRLASSRPEWRGRFRLALPWMTLFLAAWSAGESAGYLGRRGAA